MVAAPEDLIAVVDTLIRISFLLLAVRAYRHAAPDQRRMLLFLFGFFIAFTIISSVGTTTLGTAMRHNLKVFWIIAAIGALAWTGSRNSTVVRRAYPAPPAIIRRPRGGQSPEAPNVSQPNRG